jgi:elongation factor 1 alpha-like protein
LNFYDPFPYLFSFLYFTVTKERERALKLSQLKAAASSLANSAGTPVGSPAKGQKKVASFASPSKKHNVDQQQLDISGLNLSGQNFDATKCVEEPPKMSMAQEKLLEEAKRALSAESENGRKGVSMVVIGTHFLSQILH